MFDPKSKKKTRLFCSVPAQPPAVRFPLGILSCYLPLRHEAMIARNFFVCEVMSCNQKQQKKLEIAFSVSSLLDKRKLQLRGVQSR